MSFTLNRARAACYAAVFGAFLFVGAPVRADVNCAQSPNGCCCSGHVGNVDCSYDNEVDIADLQVLVNHLFIDFMPLPSKEQANMEQDPAGNIDIGDLTMLIDHLFLTFTPLPACPRPLNHPPQTKIVKPLSATVEPFINTVTSSANSKLLIPLQWRANDNLDHPLTKVKLSYEWRIYGPYDTAWARIMRTEFVKEVFVTNDGHVYRRGLGEKMITCDTFPMPDGMTVECETTWIDQITSEGPLGHFDTTILVDDPVFALNPELNKIARQSGTLDNPWVADTSDTAFNLFANEVIHQTTLGTFYLWVRARDADDTTVVDSAPPSRSFEVLNPKFENDILVVYSNTAYTINPVKRNQAQSYWQQAVSAWSPDKSFQWYMPETPTGLVLPLKLLLEHKIIILYGDDVIPGILQASSVRSKIMAVQDAGVAVWLCGRDPAWGGEDKPTQLSGPLGWPWQYYFGMTSYSYSGWEWLANGFHVDPPVRVEDFIGAKAAFATGWPDLVVDTGYLHSRYVWNYDWIPSIACPPEVNVIVPVPEAEILYTYESKYGENYPYTQYTPACQGGVVGYRLDRGIFRTVVTNFSPVFMSDSGGVLQTVVDSVLNWLYDPTPGEKPMMSTIPIGRTEGLFNDATEVTAKREAGGQDEK